MISVVIPAYNAQDSISNAIQSILDQTRVVHEIIVVNDGSTDSTEEVVKQYQTDNGVDIKLINQANAGPSVARNHGVQLAIGKWIAFLDADDIWEKDKIEKQMILLESHPEYALSGTLVEFSKVNKTRPFEKIRFSELLVKNRVFTSTVVIDREVLLRVGGFREDMKYSEDYNLWLKVTKKNLVMVLNDRLVQYGGGKGVLSEIGLSSNMWEMQKGELKNFLEIYQLGYISLGKYIALIVFSCTKFIRRKILKFFK